MLNKCPYCNSNQFFKINNANQSATVKYVLTEVDTLTNEFLATSGMPVDAYGCLDCKGVVLINEKLHRD